MAILHWLDAFHIIAALIIIAIYFGLISQRQRAIAQRKKTEQEQRAAFIRNIPDDFAQGESSPGRNIVLGVMQGGFWLLLTLLFVFVLQLTSFDNFFSDRGFESTLAQITVLKTAQSPQANARICQIVEARLAKKLSPEKQKMLACEEYFALLDWGKTAQTSSERKEKFQEAKTLAEKWKIDAQLAQAAIESEELKQKLQEAMLAPADLAEGVKGAITQIDTSVFPPTIVAYVSVEDGNGEPIEWLKPKDFVITHNDAQITKFEVAPISEVDQSNIILLMDTSGSTKGEPLLNSQAGAREFFTLLGPNDQAELIVFSEFPQKLVPWQKDKKILCAAVSKLKARGNTAIYDSLHKALNDLENMDGQKIIVLFTDGSDTSSTIKLETVLQEAKNKKIPIYAIGLASKDLAPEILQRIAGETGGCYLEAASSTELQDLYRKIAGKIKKQYRIVFNPEIQSEKTASLSITVGRKNYLKLARQYSLK